MKKVITVLLLMLLFAAFGINAFAATNEGISTCANNVITVITGFDINASMSALTSLGKLLSYYKVAPNPIPSGYIPYSVNSSGTVTYPRIAWDVGNNVTYSVDGVTYNCGNDVFTVAVWTNTGELLFRTETTSTYFRFNASQWSEVVESGASSVIVSVAGEDDDTEYWTGYFFSEGVSVSAN